MAIFNLDFPYFSCMYVLGVIVCISEQLCDKYLTYVFQGINLMTIFNFNSDLTIFLISLKPVKLASYCILNMYFFY